MVGNLPWDMVIGLVLQGALLQGVVEWQEVGACLAIWWKVPQKPASPPNL